MVILHSMSETFHYAVCNCYYRKIEISVMKELIDKTNFINR